MINNAVVCLVGRVERLKSEEAPLNSRLGSHSLSYFRYL